MKTKRLGMMLLLISLIFAATITAQTVSFTYDEAGNRLTRALVISKINNDNGTSSGNEQKSILALDETITIEDVRIVISPNPNGGKFSVSINNFREKGNVELYLHTMLGKQIYCSKQPLLVNTIDITNQKNGTYVLTVVVNGTKETWKVIKQ